MGDKWKDRVEAALLEEGYDDGMTPAQRHLIVLREIKNLRTALYIVQIAIAFIIGYLFNALGPIWDHW